MRASRRSKGQAAKSKGQTISSRKTSAPIPDIHISGAEGICSKKDIKKTVQDYVDRARTHPRGKPDSIVITIEKLTTCPIFITALPVMTVKCTKSDISQDIVSLLLRRSGVSDKAIASALFILQSAENMRGASLVLSSSGRRVEPDTQRGIRASRFGIAKKADSELSIKLTALDINTQTVREALMLASKVASCRDIVAEVCISDDPDYTTGYVASASLGYLRIPHIKKKRDRRGGRIFFLKEDADIKAVIEYLEKRPVIIDRTKSCAGEKTIDEILDRSHK